MMLNFGLELKSESSLSHRPKFDLTTNLITTIRCQTK